MLDPPGGPGGARPVASKHPSPTKAPLTPRYPAAAGSVTFCAPSAPDFTEPLFLNGAVPGEDFAFSSLGPLHVLGISSSARCRPSANAAEMIVLVHLFTRSRIP
jgi:hypothetical protein